MKVPEREIEIGGRRYVARQLTLSEVIAWMEAPPEFLKGMEEIDVLLLSGDGVALSDILMMTDATLEDLKAMTESDLGDLAELVKEANPRFFQMRGSLGRLFEAKARQQTSD